MMNHAATTSPAPLHWRTAFDVGDARVDGEHRALIEVANELCALAATEPPLKVLRGAARELIAVVEAHFESEEGLFPAISFPGQRAHVREHISILAALNVLLLRDGAASPAVAAATARLLLLEHIVRHDLGFKTCVDVSREH